ncbi:unnamed protein product [Urochloa decumbens]|uniref:BTB domain-containing protein n=1 Tax=Urochloa decumbens TaxID=240449 RepID=A0ABC9GG06_9POAL
MNMKHSCTHLPEEARSVHLLKIDGFSVTRATIGNNKDHIKSRCSVFGYDWEIRLYPASLISRTEYLSPSDRGILVYIASGTTTDDEVQGSGTLIVECTISVLREPEEANICLPDSSGNLHRHLGELLQSEVGADVTFAVSGESLAAHKNILAARSPVFKAEFFGDMQERTTQHMVPELHCQQEVDEGEEAVMAQHLLVAADRYGLDGLKVMCEKRLTLGIGISMVASTLALAEQHNCPRLKAKCIEFIAGSPENLDAVVATEGYRNLEVSSPWVLTELLKDALSKK